MGGLCAKSSTKRQREKERDAANDKADDTSKAAQLLPSQTANRGFDASYPAHDPAEAEREKAALAAGSTGLLKAAGKDLAVSATRNEGSEKASSSRRPSSGSVERPHDANSAFTSATAAAGAAADPTCPSSAHKGENYDRWFPPEHDADMKLGAGKYNGVGVPSPSSEVPSADLHSLGSTPSHRVSSFVTSTSLTPQRPPPGTYDPTLFVDEDSAAPVTASSAFMTPCDLRDGSDMASIADNASLVSHGSMMSQHAHGYHYYNSSLAGSHGVAPTPSSSRRRSIGSSSIASDAVAPQSLRPAKTAMTVTNVRTNRQIPATSSIGAVTPLSRRSSLAGSDRFQSCRSISDASTSVGAVTRVDVRLLSAQQGRNYSGRRHSSFSSQLSGNCTPRTPESDGRMFYSCRSFGTASVQSGASPVDIPPLPSSSSLYRTSNRSLGSSTGLREVVPLPLHSLRGSPRTHCGGTPRAQQELLYRQSRQQSECGVEPASEAFSVSGARSQNVFLDLPSAAETATVYARDDERDLELPRSAVAEVDTSSAVTRALESPVAIVPASNYSVAAASSPQDMRRLAAADGGGDAPELINSPDSSSASSAWLAAPVLTKTKVPSDRQRRTTKPDVDGAADAGAGAPPSKGPEASASGYEADASGSAAAGWKGAKKTSNERQEASSKPCYAKVDFLHDPNAPPPANARSAAAAAVLGSLSPSKRSEDSPVPTAVELTAMTDSTYATLSTPSETSSRKSSVARPTTKYLGGGGKQIGGNEQSDAVQPCALQSATTPPTTQQQDEAAPSSPYTHQTTSSTHSFSTMTSSYRRERQERQGAACSTDSPQMDGEKSAAVAGSAGQTRRRCLPPKGKPKQSIKAPSSLQRHNVAAGAAELSPTMPSPNPWAPGSATGDVTSVHVDPPALDKNNQLRSRERSIGAMPTSTGVAGRTSTLPGRRTTGGAAAGSAAVAAAGRAKRTPNNTANRPRRTSKEPLSWSSLTPSPAANPSAKPRPKPSLLTKARKTERAAGAAAQAARQPQSIISSAEESDLQLVTRVSETADSVVEYELFTGELADVEVDSTADDTAVVAHPCRTQMQPRELLNSHNAPIFRASPKPRAEHHRPDVHVSPVVSSNVLPSTETASFMQPYTDVQLASEMNSGNAERANDAWLTPATTTNSTAVAEDGNAVMLVEMSAPRPVQEEDNDEGYEADAGMQNMHGGTLPLSASAASDDGFIMEAATRKAAAAHPCAPQTSAGTPFDTDTMSGKDSQSAWANAVDVPSSSSADLPVTAG
ncbi:hypothetical protein ABL78_4009 [Leptomonas seymouri]|uniref:Uncharacterized protein n=1 Tax=Leptomonas seymouri TaxID=5684 RepID=A0A0N0P5V8_LEPSE|nr:hypothetical protein ABL78_4009 [Leptomonas seymouri]|eukprot:KPI86916.1 hypothetical protein ABL78_4009 [Leptomonas seymouri]